MSRTGFTERNAQIAKKARSFSEVDINDVYPGIILIK